MVFKKPDWGPPPPGYIAGLGRGATGFITRGDIGPSRSMGEVIAEISGAPPGLGKGRGRGNAPPGLSAQAPPENDNQITADRNFDDWNGYGDTIPKSQQQ